MWNDARPDTARWQRSGSLLVALVALAYLAAGDTAAQTTSRTIAGQTQAKYTQDGVERCVHCHAGERMQLMSKTVHGNAENLHTPYAQQGCESCHGPGSLHVSRARGGRGFPKMLGFTASESAAAKNLPCLQCHEKDLDERPGMAWRGSVHEQSDLACVSCHELHRVDNPLRDKEYQIANCRSCHKRTIARHPRFEDKGIVFDKLFCHDCHDVHQLVRAP